MASVAALCAALVAFTLNARPDDPAAAVPPSDLSGVAAAPEASPDLSGVAAATEASPDLSGVAAEPEASPYHRERVATAVEPYAPASPSIDRDERRRRSRRWRRVNRYPGPIPTPEEWEPPEGPVRVALQVGHWRTDEAPRELNGLRDGGTRWRGTAEWEVNLTIAQRTAELLRAEGYEVDVLPAVVPPGYRAHLFISIHADGSNDPGATGYRIAAPRWDATGRADQVAELLERSYGEATGLPLLPTVTRRMSAYYAFNFRRYEHALHPMTVAVILETGFLTSARDRRVIVDAPERAARGIVDAVRAFPVTRLPQDVSGFR